MKQFRDTNYFVTDSFEIYNKVTNRYVKPYLGNFSKGHKRLAVGLYINGKQKNFLYHRIIAEVFIPNPNNLPQINHIDGNHLNNCLENLEWCTAGYNNIHAIQTGLRPTKLNQEKADEIRNLLAFGYKINEICKMYNVGRNIISKIRDNISWKK